MRPTSVGERLRQSAERVLSELDAAEREMRDGEPRLEGSLRVADRVQHLLPLAPGGARGLPAALSRHRNRHRRRGDARAHPRPARRADRRRNRDRPGQGHADRHAAALRRRARRGAVLGSPDAESALSLAEHLAAGTLITYAAPKEELTIFQDVLKPAGLRPRRWLPMQLDRGDGRDGARRPGDRDHGALGGATVREARRSRREERHPARSSAAVAGGLAAPPGAAALPDGIRARPRANVESRGRGLLAQRHARLAARGAAPGGLLLAPSSERGVAMEPVVGIFTTRNAAGRAARSLRNAGFARGSGAASAAGSGRPRDRGDPDRRDGGGRASRRRSAPSSAAPRAERSASASARPSRACSCRGRGW